MKHIRFVFFGTSYFSTVILDELKIAKFVPDLIVTTPDKPEGRKLILTPPPVKVWALENSIPFIQPEKLKDESFLNELKKKEWDVFIVASYGKIIPKELLEIPKHKTLNVHPSLLPKFRGASPIQYTILNDEKTTGITIMRIDEEMDHGPIVAQDHMTISEWPTTKELKKELGSGGGRLLATILPTWVAGELPEIHQKHEEATYTKKISKSDGLIDLTEDPYLNYRKIQAFSDWPSAYFFIDHKGNKMRVLIKKAQFKDGNLEILRVVPEGKQEMDYQDFLRGYRP